MVALNDIKRVMTPRMQVCEHLIESMEKLINRINRYGIQSDSIDELEHVLDQCRRDTEYAAVKATRILNSDEYIAIKEKLQGENKWNIRLKQLEDELLDIKLDIL